MNDLRSQCRDKGDDRRLRHARQRHTGFQIGRYLQPPPLLFTRDGHNVFLGDMYRGRAAFLIAGGPSLLTYQLEKLTARGILTCAMNNAAALFRPNLWLSVDNPGNFCDTIWRDPAILKFVPLCHMEKKLTVRNQREELAPSEEIVGDMPAVFGFRRNEAFVAERWLYEDTFNWGNHSSKVDAYGNKGCRSVMFVALRLLFFLGVRRLYLLGCDFRMENDAQNYAFKQARSRGSVRGNNSSYRIMNVRFKHLLPYFERECYRVFNCKQDSGLTVFPHVSFEDAVADAAGEMPPRMLTEGMYNRPKAKRRQAQKPKRDKRERLRRAAGSKAALTPAAAGGGGDKPAITLVIGLNETTGATWRESWARWLTSKPWLERLPVLIGHDGISEPESLEPKSGGGPCRERLVRLESVASQEAMQSALVRLIASEVNTPWCWILDPRAVPTRKRSAFGPDWLPENRNGRSPVLAGGTWGSVQPADGITRLNDWGNHVPGLREHPEVTIPFDPDGVKIRYPTITPWFVLASTEWLRRIAALTPPSLPCRSAATYLHYWARRRDEPVQRIKLIHLGWKCPTG